MIDKFIYGFLDRVYGADDYTQQEINSKLIQKMDEVIENCNSAFDFVDWLKEQGVPDEVKTVIDTMLEDGTLENLINVEKINELSTNLNNSINQLTKDTEAKVNQMETTMNTKIDENVALINQSKQELDTLMDNFEQQTGTLIDNFKNEVNTELKDIKSIKVCINLEQFKTAITEAETKPTLIYLVNGEYTLDAPVYIPSNTKIVGLGNVVIKGTGMNAYFLNKTNGQAVNYDGSKNITLENLTFDGLNNGTGLTMVGIAHAENITIENCTFKDLHMWHMIELNAVKHGYIKNCKFDNYGTSGSKGTEAVQLDAMISESQFPWFGNYDSIANDHIIIEGNSFTNIGVKAIGGHSFANGVIQKNIYINHNSFENVYEAVHINDFNNLNVTNNTSKNVRNFVISENVNNSSYNLNVIGNTHIGYYVNSMEGLGDERFVMLNSAGNKGDLRIEFVNITNNHVSSCSGHGVGYTANYVTVANNDFYNIARHGIYHYGGLCGSIIGNTFKDTGKEDSRYSIAIGNNANEPSKGVIVNANSIANLRGIQVGSNVTGCIVSSNVGQIVNGDATGCTSVNNVTI